MIGNPPYIRIQTLNEYSKEQVDYFNVKYSEYISGNYDIYILFIVKGYEHLKRNSFLGFILPHKFFQGETGKNIRKYIADQSCVKRIVNFSTNQIFDAATTYTCLLFLEKAVLKEFKYKKYELRENYKELEEIQFQDIDSNLLHRSMWNFHTRDTQSILDKIAKKPFNFREITEKIFKGSSTGNDKVYLLKLKSRGENSSLLFSTSLNKDVKIENELLKRFIYGQDVRRYRINQSDILLLFPYTVVDNKAFLIDNEILREKYPHGFKYLMDNKNLLVKRKIKLGENDFYKYSAARSLVEYHKRKILVPDMLVMNRIAIDCDGEIFHGPAIHSVVLSKNDAVKDDRYYLGILNSKIFWFFIKNTSTALRGDAFRLTPEFLNPFKFPDTNNAQTKKLVELVQRMLDLHQSLSAARDPRTREQLGRQIEVTDRQIDRLVYQLYELTEEEIKIVEGQ